MTTPKAVKLKKVRAFALLVGVFALAGCDDAKLKTQSALESICWDRCEPINGTFICTRSHYQGTYKSVVISHDAAFVDHPTHVGQECQKK